MKHTLQSLLMTTVLTLPTVFGSEPLSTSTDPTTTHSSIVKLSRRAFNLKADPEAAARLYLNSLNDDSRWNDVSFVAQMLEKLEYIASAYYERSADHPAATPDDIRDAAKGLKDLGSSYPEGSDKRTEYENKAAALLSRLPG